MFVQTSSGKLVNLSVYGEIFVALHDNYGGDRPDRWEVAAKTAEGLWTSIETNFSRKADAEAVLQGIASALSGGCRRHIVTIREDKS